MVFPLAAVWTYVMIRCKQRLIDICQSMLRTRGDDVSPTVTAKYVSKGIGNLIPDKAEPEPGNRHRSSEKSTSRRWSFPHRVQVMTVSQMDSTKHSPVLVVETTMMMLCVSAISASADDPLRRREAFLEKHRRDLKQQPVRPSQDPHP